MYIVFLNLVWFVFVKEKPREECKRNELIQICNTSSHYSALILNTFQNAIKESGTKERGTKERGTKERGTNEPETRLD